MTSHGSASTQGRDLTGVLWSGARCSTGRLRLLCGMGRDRSRKQGLPLALSAGSRRAFTKIIREYTIDRCETSGQETLSAPTMLGARGKCKEILSLIVTERKGRRQRLSILRPLLLLRAK